MIVAVSYTNQPTEQADVLDSQISASSVLSALKYRGHQGFLLPIDKSTFSDLSAVIGILKKKKVDCVFNVFEGFSDESWREALFAEMLEKNNILFTGNPSQALKACLDKGKLKRGLASKGFKCPAGRVVKSCRDIDKFRWTFPLFVKPCSEDASCGIDNNSLTRDIFSLEKAISLKIKEFPGGLVVEEFIDGDEYSAACLGNDPYLILGISRISFSADKSEWAFVSYDSKWNKYSEEYARIKPVDLTDKTCKVYEFLSDQCNALGRLLGLRGYFRVDFRYRGDTCYILDVNPNPDISSDSGFSRQALGSGFDYAAMVEQILLLGLQAANSNIPVTG